MKIGIDARMYGIEHAGIGRYVENLVIELTGQNPKTEFVLFLRKSQYKQLSFGKNVKKVLAEFRHYTLTEQIEFPRLLKNSPVDLMHFPHFNVPILYKGPFVVTIHDLLWHEVKGMRVTTLNPLVYLVKYVGYQLVVERAVKKARKVLVPSRWVREQVVEHIGVRKSKIVVTNEGIDEDYLGEKKGKKISKLISMYGIDGEFIVHTGSAYPHKNLRRLIQSVSIINRLRKKSIKLVIVSARSIFLTQLKRYVASQGLGSQVIFAGRLTDKEVVSLYKEAKMLVHPSLSEGFGLTGLEAMAVGTPVLASNAGSLPEIYGNAALYVDPQDSADIAKGIEKILEDKKLAKLLIANGYRRVEKYSWTRTAKKTFNVYRQVLKRR
jgi:hypothetical protein